MICKLGDKLYCKKSFNTMFRNFTYQEDKGYVITEIKYNRIKIAD